MKKHNLGPKDGSRSAFLFIVPSKSHKIFTFCPHDFEFACLEDLMTMVFPSRDITVMPLNLEAEIATWSLGSF